MRKEIVKKHYNEEAKKRNKRLLKDDWSIYKHNYLLRYRIIKEFIENNLPIKKAIDIGTGTGTWSEFLSDYCQEALGIDFASKNISIAQKRAKEKKIKNCFYVLADAEKMQNPKNNYYDVALQVSVLQHLENKKEALNRVNEILKKKGLFIILVHNKNCIFNLNLQKTKKEKFKLITDQYYSYEEIKNLLELYNFRIIETKFIWLFINDFLKIGSRYTFLNVFKERIAKIIYFFENFINNFSFLNLFFREIIILAQKR